MDICHLKWAESEPKLEKIQRQSRAPWWHCERGVWSLRSFHWTGLVCIPDDCRKSNGCYCKIARLCPPLKKNWDQNVQTYGYVFHDTKWPKSFSNIEDPVGTSRTKFIWTPTGTIVMEKAIRGSSIGTWMVKSWKVPNWECLFVHWKQGLFLSVCVDDIRMKQNLNPMWKKLVKMLILTHQLHFLTMYIWDLLNVNANRMKLFLRNIHWCLNHVFLLEQLKSYQVGKNRAQNSRVVLRHGGTCSKMRWAILRAGKQKRGAALHSFQSLVGWSPIQKRKNLNQLENYHKYARKMFWSACTWHEMRDQTFRGLSINLQEQSQNGLRLVTDVWQDWFLTFITRVITDTTAMMEPQHCTVDWDLFQDSDLAGDFEDSKSTSGGVLCIFGSRTFVSISWMCKKQTKTKTPIEKGKRDVEQLSNVDYAPTKTHSSQGESLLYIFWRQRSCHQDDHQRTKSINETHVQNPQSCAWLVVRPNQFRTEDLNQICWQQEPTFWHANQREFHAWRVESSSSFVQHHEFLDVLLQPFFFCNFLSDVIGKQSAMSKRGQEATSSEGSSLEKPKPMNPMSLVLHNPLSARKNPPQDLSNPVNLENVDEDRDGQSRSGKPVRTNLSQDPIEYSQVSRQEQLNMQTLAWKQGDRDLKGTCAGGEHKGRFSEHEDHKPSIFDEGFPFFAKVGNQNRLLNI